MREIIVLGVCQHVCLGLMAVCMCAYMCVRRLVFVLFNQTENN